MSSEITTQITTLCKRCGKAIPQQRGRGRPRLYCPEGDCAAQAKRVRELRRSTPGLEGALARAEELYEQIDQSLASALQPLVEALHAETDPVEIEARQAEIRADAETAVRAARAERAEAYARAEELGADNAGLRQKLTQSLTVQEEATKRAADAVNAQLEAQKEQQSLVEAAQQEATQAALERASAVESKEQAFAERAAALEKLTQVRTDSELAVQAADRDRIRALEQADEAGAQMEQAREESAQTVEQALNAMATAKGQAETAETARQNADRKSAELTNAVGSLNARVEELIGQVAIARHDAETARKDSSSLRQRLEDNQAAQQITQQELTVAVEIAKQQLREREAEILHLNAKLSAHLNVKPNAEHNGQIGELTIAPEGNNPKQV